MTSAPLPVFHTNPLLRELFAILMPSDLFGKTLCCLLLGCWIIFLELNFAAFSKIRETTASDAMKTL
jgi:hypothetical protein